MTASEALQNSIEHWERLADSTPGETISTDECALCRKFLYGRGRPNCAGCPVFIKTGKQYCRGTPYYNVELAVKEFGYNSEQFRAAARRELEFLQSLNA